MEYGLGLFHLTISTKKEGSLNPCCSGIWSRTAVRKHRRSYRQYVLILVVVEYGLGLIKAYDAYNKATEVLILVVVEYGLGQHSTINI